MRNRSLAVVGATLVFGCTAIPAAIAQSRPDAGSLQQQIERERQPTLPPKAEPQPEPPPEMAPTGGATITVSRFRFAGNTELTDAELQPVVAGFLGRPLTFGELRRAAALVAETYRAAGWIVRTYLPAQEIVDNVVTIQIVEATLGAVHVESPPSGRTSVTAVEDIIAAQQKIGDRLSAPALDRALLLVGDLPGADASSSLRPGAAGGQTDLVVKLADKPLADGDLTLDNTGARATGEARAAADLHVNSPFGAGERFDGLVIHTADPTDLGGDGSDYGKLAASLPVGADGLRVGVEASYLSYSLIAHEFRALDGDGSSARFGIDANYPLVRSRAANLYVNADLDQTDFVNRSLGVDTSRYKTDTVSLGLSGNLFDHLGGGGANAADVALIGGNLDLDGSPNQAAVAATTRAGGTFAKLRYAASRQQAITETTSVYAALTGQWASKNLDSSEQFYLGGADGVRAYPANEAGGADATLLNLELRQQLPYGITVAGLFDYGRVTVNPDNDFPRPATPNDYSLKGAGLSAMWQSEIGATVKLTYGRRLGDNPDHTPTGRDQDGSLEKNRVWLSVSMAF